MKDLLDFFKENDVSIQITLDIGCFPTVHAFDKKHYNKLLFSEGNTISEALENVKIELLKQREVL